MYGLSSGSYSCNTNMVLPRAWRLRPAGCISPISDRVPRFASVLSAKQCTTLPKRSATPTLVSELAICYALPCLECSNSGGLPVTAASSYPRTPMTLQHLKLSLPRPTHKPPVRQAHPTRHLIPSRPPLPAAVLREALARPLKSPQASHLYLPTAGHPLLAAAMLRPHTPYLSLLPSRPLLRSRLR